MAVRTNLVNNAVNAVNNANELKVQQRKMELEHYRTSILSDSNFDEIVDALDTYIYAIENGLETQLEKFKFDFTTKKIGFRKMVGTDGEEDVYLYFQFNNWKKENTGPYNWYVYTNGCHVWVGVGDDSHIDFSYLSDMIDKARFDKDNGYVVAPIIKRGGYYTCHNSDRPLSALKMFNSKLKSFLNEFFKEFEKLCE